MPIYKCSSGRSGNGPGDTCVRTVQGDTPRLAVERYVEMHLCDLDYPTDIDVWVETAPDTFKLFEVIVRAVPEAEAREKTPLGRTADR